MMYISIFPIAISVRRCVFHSLLPCIRSNIHNKGQMYTRRLLSVSMLLKRRLMARARHLSVHICAINYTMTSGMFFLASL